MFDGINLKFMGELFYLTVAACSLYGAWTLFRQYRAVHSTIIKTHVLAYELQKMIESRPR